ncbi:lysozyme [Cognatishimia sp.]|uniref:lysozyme n=1 Tax=Cognatishimia sp. TaxID=2211648 RepID=UPI0035158E3A|nr:lysozyme [Cognatishimia sp.]
MRLSKKGIELLHLRETIDGKPNLTAYQDTVGVWTIGYGNTFYTDGGTVKEGDKLTKKQCDDLFEEVLEEYFELPMQKLLGNIKLKQYEYDALVSFCYNVGMSAFENSTMLRLLKANKKLLANKQFARWVFPKEITSRRKAESRQFADIEHVTRADLDPIVGWC